MENAFISPKTFSVSEIFNFFSSFLSNLLRFEGEVDNRIIMTLLNCLHKLPVVFIKLTQKPL